MTLPEPRALCRHLSEKLACAMGGQLRGVVVFGGVARNDFIQGWSDIDLLLSLDRVSWFTLDVISKLRAELRYDYCLRSDFVALSGEDIGSRTREVCRLTGMTLNALSGRPGTGDVIYGDVPLQAPSYPEVETREAAGYLIQTSYRLRKLFQERPDLPDERIQQLARSIRWISSVVRCALRTYGTFCLPYEDLLPEVERRFPTLNTDSLVEAFALRRRWVEATPVDSLRLLRELAFFTERFMDVYFAQRQRV